MEAIWVLAETFVVSYTILYSSTHEAVGAS
jgi:hypothetical protein